MAKDTGHRDAFVICRKTANIVNEVRDWSGLILKSELKRLFHARLKDNFEVRRILSQAGVTVDAYFDTVFAAADILIDAMEILWDAQKKAVIQSFLYDMTWKLVALPCVAKSMTPGPCTCEEEAAETLANINK